MGDASSSSLPFKELAGMEAVGVRLARSASFPFSFHDGGAFGRVESGVRGSWGYIVAKPVRRGMRRRGVRLQKIVQKIYSSQLLGQNGWARPHKLHRRHGGGAHGAGSHTF